MIKRKGPFEEWFRLRVLLRKIWLKMSGICVGFGAFSGSPERLKETVMCLDRLPKVYVALFKYKMDHLLFLGVVQFNLKV